MGIDLSQYPEPLQDILKIVQDKAALNAPEAIQEAMQWVYDEEEQYMPAYLIEEMEAIGEGVCSTLGDGCNVTAMQEQVKRFNMFPELIQMACSAFGAWGPATPSGSLLQVGVLPTRFTLLMLTHVL